MTPMPVLPPLHQSTVASAHGSDARLREAAVQLEATFLSEMLKAAGLGETPDGFGGGEGEEQFASFLRDTQALAMAQSGGIGLAEALFEAMKVRFDA